MALDPGVQSGVTEKVVSQLSSKTVGGPQADTGLTGDKIPASVLQPADFDRAKNQINVDVANLELIEKLNQIGQLSGRQSSSGPMPRTAKIVQSSISTSGEQTIPFTPGPNEVWEFQGVDAERAGSGQILYQLYLTDTNNGTEVYFYYMKSSDSNVLFFADADANYFNSPIYFDENVTLKCEATDSGGTLTGVTFSVAIIRVR